MIIDVYLTVKSRRLGQARRSASRKGNKWWGAEAFGRAGGRTRSTLLAALKWTNPETRCELLIDDFWFLIEGPCSVVSHRILRLTPKGRARTWARGSM
jgi:hypothetical protein